MSYYGVVRSTDSLTHHGVKGMHWGIRRYQNYDGTRIGSSAEAEEDWGKTVDDFTSWYNTEKSTTHDMGKTSPIYEKAGKEFNYESAFDSAEP